MVEEGKLDIHRIQSLTDATFAVAMTILILEIKIPPGLTKNELLQYFMDYSLFDLLIYAIGFISLGVFWISSHFHHNIISKTDKNSSWLNLIFLLVICMIPFSVSLIKNYRNDHFSIIFHCIILIAASIMNLSMLYYAWKKKHTKEFYSVLHFRNARRRILMPVVIYIVIIIVSFFSINLSLYLFLTPFIIHMLPEKNRIKSSVSNL